MSELKTKFDAWLSDSGPAALVIREHLMAVEGRDGVVFPATYAASQDGSSAAVTISTLSTTPGRKTSA